METAAQKAHIPQISVSYCGTLGQAEQRRSANTVAASVSMPGSAGWARLLCGRGCVRATQSRSDYASRQIWDNHQRKTHGAIFSITLHFTHIRSLGHRSRSQGGAQPCPVTSKTQSCVGCARHTL